MKRNWRTHYNIVLANFVLVLVLGINLAVKNFVIDRVDVSIDSQTIGAMSNINIFILLIAPMIGFLISGFLYFLDVKYFFADYSFKKFHFNKKWSKFYMLGIFLFCLNLLLVFVLMIVSVLITNSMKVNFINVENETLDKFRNQRDEMSNFMNIFLWISFALTCLISLFSFGLTKYARFKIDVELLQREHGKFVDQDMIDQKTVVIDLDSNIDKKRHPKFDNKPEKTKDKPTAGLSEI